MSIELRLTPGVNEFAGYTTVVKKVKPFELVLPGSTAYHEATHTVAGLKTGSEVRIASRKPGPGYLGITILGGYNKYAFAAAFAKGCNGAEHDLAVMRMMGDDPGTVASAIGSILNDEDEILAVASLIESRGAITGTDAWWAMDKIANPEFDIKIIDPLGRIRHFVEKTRKGDGLFITTGIS